MSTLQEPARRDRLVIALVYSLAWVPLLVNRGLYWDDWVSLGRTPADLVQGILELGQPLAVLVFVPLLSLPLPGLVGHAIVFLAYLASTLLLHAILRRLPGLRRMDALVASLTFALLPANYARIALADLMYGLSLLAFLAATWLLIRFIDQGGLARRVAALVLYAVSFYTASLLVLFVVPVLLAALLLWRSDRGSLPSLALRHADFLILPVAYWLLKAAFFTPFGAYAGYNSLSLEGFLRVPQAMVTVPSQVLVEPLVRAVAVAGLLGIGAGIVVAVWLVRRSSVVEEGRFLPGLALAAIGAGLVALGIFAYLAVGLVPSVWDWNSRHQLLVPLGVGVLAAGAARGVSGLSPVGRSGGVVIVGLLLGVSLVANARTLVAYQLDWFKQQALIEAVRADPQLQSARHIRVVDAASGLNAMRRAYRFYELNALFRAATGTTDRLVALAGGEPAPDILELVISRPAYQMSDYVPTPIDLEMRVSPGDRPGALGVLRLVLLEALDSRSFAVEVSRLVDVRATRPAGVP